MSRVFLLSLVSLSSLFALEYHSYDEALKLQKKNSKTIMIDVVRDDCHYCEDMDREVLQDAQMSKYLTSKFIPVKLNLDRDE
ncbi:MAG: thioredoxin family protein, partial [Campylobacterota bacterium]|nr:thioredoxin family protein [Campylobacterota bacterium]